MNTLRKSVAFAALITFGTITGGAGAAISLTVLDADSFQITFTDHNWASTRPDGSSNIFIDVDHIHDGVGFSDNGLNWSLGPGGILTYDGGNLSSFGTRALLDYIGGNHFQLSGFFSMPLGATNVNGTLTYDLPGSHGISIGTPYEVYWGHNGVTYKGGVLLDSGSVSGIPEPSSALLLGLGSLSLLARRRR